MALNIENEYRRENGDGTKRPATVEQREWTDHGPLTWKEIKDGIRALLDLESIKDLFRFKNSK